MPPPRSGPGRCRRDIHAGGVWEWNTPVRTGRPSHGLKPAGHIFPHGRAHCVTLDYRSQLLEPERH